MVCLTVGLRNQAFKTQLKRGRGREAHDDEGPRPQEEGGVPLLPVRAPVRGGGEVPRDVVVRVGNAHLEQEARDLIAQLVAFQRPNLA